MNSLVRGLLILGLFAGGMGCTPSKVPLRESWGSFELAAAHWFENEKTQYVFFSINGLKSEQAREEWPSAFELSVDHAPFVPLDFSKAVHRHRIVACGEGRLCGSYSFKADRPASSIEVRFRYHVDSALTRETPVPNSAHASGSSADAQSALIYGVFNSTNEQLQVRVHDNFGTPNSEDIKKFGMERAFEVRDVSLASITEREEKELQQASGTALLFPATPCEPLLKKAGRVISFRTSRARAGTWVNEKLGATDEGNVACFSARALDQRGEVLLEKPAMARRNPVLAPDATYLRTPLREARRIPLVISYCQRGTGDTSLVSPLFLEYQRFILGFGKAPVDLCFAIGGEDTFASELERVINLKIAAARAASQASGESSDFMIVLAVNHRLAPIVTRFHQLLAATLNRKVAEERAMHSPRLVGAFVYDSGPAEERGVNLEPGVVWCPRLEPKSEAESGRLAPTAANCMGYRGGRLDFGLFNFVIPMGPFPTLEAYESHVREVGDRGLSRNPQLSFQSVKTDVNSVTLPNQTVTFFDGERVTLQKGEGLRFCRERDEEGVLDSLMFRVTSPDGGTGSSAEPSAPLIRSVGELMGYAKSGVARMNLEVGIGWEQPFWGGLTFEVPLEGKVMSVIPLNFSAKERQKLGDAKWQRPLWRVGSLLQKCTKYCDHPFFDEAGEYQAGTTWRSSWSACPQPHYPEPNE